MIFVAYVFFCAFHKKTSAPFEIKRIFYNKLFDKVIVYLNQSNEFWKEKCGRSKNCIIAVVSVIFLALAKDIGTVISIKLIFIVLHSRDAVENCHYGNFFIK